MNDFEPEDSRETLCHEKPRPVSPIEMLIISLKDDVIVEEVMEPENCAMIYIGDQRYHVTIEKIDG